MEQRRIGSVEIIVRWDDGTEAFRSTTEVSHPNWVAEIFATQLRRAHQRLADLYGDPED